ncbi:2-phosphosulfolactate phosphatase [Agromyces italicus]|uniref:2-phosphosulfolactate phosphatase n=1 Tax=Agromyces italicus TaxID=279572 RepID=UPI0003B6E146|nr:2-phosphosulfolactate phosphatase [Agromyces italicus]
MSATTDPFGQAKYQVRFDWGAAGADRIAPGVHAVVLVDALSFTTAVVVAAEHGTAVAPWPSDDLAGAAAFAAAHDGVVAVRRGEAGPSLSPSSFIGAPEAAPLVVVPSPNGGALAHRLGVLGVPVIAASMRNRTAVAERLLAMQAEHGDRFMIAVVAAGERAGIGSAGSGGLAPDAVERRPAEPGSPLADGTRFAIEDLLVAGAVIDALVARGIDHTSPEAAVACAAYEGLSRATGHLISASGSGVELRELGFAGDARLAAERDVTPVVPVLRGGVFVAE